MFGKLTLIECRHCSKKVSIESKLCVHCGCPEPDNEKFLVNRYNSQLSVKLYKFFNASTLYSFVDFCGWFFLICILYFVSDVYKSPWGLKYYIVFLLAGSICGSIYATSYIFIKKYWMKQEDKEDWSVYLFMGIIFFTFIFGLLFYFLTVLKDYFFNA